MKTLKIFSLNFCASNIHDFSSFVIKKIVRDKKNLKIINLNTVSILPTTMHEIVNKENNASFLKVLNKVDYLTMDGMPLVLIGKLKSKLKIDRVYGPDIMLNICDIGQKKEIKHYFYGGTTKSNDSLKKNLLKKFPSLMIVGSFSPPFRNLSRLEYNSVIKNISNSKPDILWIGLGGQKQVYQMERFKNELNVPVIISVGAAFDFISGQKVQAPIFVQKIGFEWFFRLLVEPKRLFKRYVINMPIMIYLILREILGSYSKHNDK